MIMIFIVLCNTALMGAQHDCSGQPYCFDFHYFSELFNAAFAIIFAMEMVLKMVGYGIVNYCKDTSNSIYVFVVAIGVAEIPFILQELTCMDEKRSLTTDPYVCESSQLSIIRVFRLVRLFRVGRLIEFSPLLHQQITVMLRIGRAVGSLVLLMAFFVVTFAILGMNLFAGQSMVAADSVDYDGNSNLVLGCRVRFVLPQNLTDVVSAKQAARTGALTGIMLRSDVSKDPVEFLVRQHSTQDERWMLLEQGLRLVDAGKKSQDMALKHATIIGLVPRSNFDDFLQSLITTFQILTLSNWDDIWYACTRSSSDTAVFFYFFAVIVFGNYILINLFAAIIIQGFAEQREELDSELREAEAHRLDIEKQLPIQFSRIPSDERERQMSEGFSLARAGSESRIYRAKSSNSADSRDPQESSKAGLGLLMSVVRVLSCGLCGVKSSKVTPEGAGDVETAAVTRQRARVAVMQERAPVWAYLHYFFLLVALADTVVLALCQGGFVLQDLEMEQQVVKYASTCCMSLALADYLLRVCTVESPTTTANIIDVLITATSVPELVHLWSEQPKPFMDPSSFIFFRAFRALRLVLRSENLCQLVQHIKLSAKPLFNTLLILLFFVVVLGILGVSQLSGKMRLCSDSLITSQEDCVGMSKAGDERRWKSRGLNYDSLFNGVLTMLVISTKDRWTELMYQAVDASDVRGQGPVQGVNPGYILLYVATVFVGGLFLLNIFAGVVVDTYKQSFMTQPTSSKKPPASDRDADKDMLHRLPPTRLQRTLLRLFKRSEFDIFMFAVVILDITSMSCMSFKAPKYMVDFTTSANFFFTSVYAAEAMSKLLCMHGRVYLSNHWNTFELSLVMLSAWGMCLERSQDNLPVQGDSFIRVLRIFRAIRVLRALRLLNIAAVQSLQDLLIALAGAARTVAQVLCTLVVIYAVFGNLTVGIFGNMCFSPMSASSVLHTWPSDTLRGVHKCLLVEDTDMVEGINFSNVGRAMVRGNLL